MAPYRTPDERDEYPEEKKPMVISNSTKAFAAGMAIVPVILLCGFLDDRTQAGSGLQFSLILAAITASTVLSVRAIAWIVVGIP